MGAVTRKRNRGAGPSPVVKKRRTPVEDSDIDSDIESISADEQAPDMSDTNSEDSIPENETAEEKRLRLARAYLRHVGVSEEAALPGEADEDDIDEDNKFLQDEALRESGRQTTYIADAVGESIKKSVEKVVAKGHGIASTCVALGGDDEIAVSGGKDSAVMVWDVATGKKKFTLRQKGITAKHKRNPFTAQGHVGNILTVAASDDGKIAASGGLDGIIRIWDLRAGKQIETLKGHRGAIQGLAFRSASQQLFSASKDRTVKVWDCQEMAFVETLFGHGADVNFVDSLARERAVSCGRDGTLRLYKVAEGSQLVYRRAMTVSIDVVAMLSEQRFVSGGDDGALCMWQHTKKKPTAVVEHAHGNDLGCESWISSIGAFRNTDLVASGAGDGQVRLWKCEDVPKLVNVGSLDVGPGFVNGIAVGKKPGLMVLAVGAEHRLGRWGRVKGAKSTIQFVRFSESV